MFVTLRHRIGFVKLLCVVPLLTVLILAGCGGGGSGSTGGKPGSGINLTIGSKNDPDGQLLAEMYALLLQNQGFNVTTKLHLGQTPVLDAAIKSGAVDIYPEFNGTAIGLYKLQGTTDPQTAYNEAKAYYEQNFHVTWLDPALQLNDSYGICTSQAMVQKYNLHSLSDLGAASDKLTLVEQQDFGPIFPTVQSAYSINFKATQTVTNISLAFDAVNKGSYGDSVAECYTTDPTILSDNFTLLTDPKNSFPPYNPSPIVRDSTLAKSSAIATTLNALESHLTTASQTALIKQVSVDNKTVPDVAKAFLQQQHLLP
jgi:osmoprotectant transport system substrate-binding protein